MTNYQKRKEKNDEYRSKIMRFTFQLSLGDGEVRDWFEQQPEKGAYLKKLILRDKAEQLGYHAECGGMSAIQHGADDVRKL